MITLRPGSDLIIEDLYKRNKGRRDTISTDDVMTLLDCVVVNVDSPGANPYAPYWEFMDNVASNIHSGRWTMHPDTWYAYIMNASYKPLSTIELEKRQTALRNKCINMLREFNLSAGSLSGRYLLLRWVRNPNGIQDILATAKTIVDLNKLFEKEK